MTCGKIRLVHISSSTASLIFQEFPHISGGFSTLSVTATSVCCLQVFGPCPTTWLVWSRLPHGRLLTETIHLLWHHHSHCHRRHVFSRTPPPPPPFRQFSCACKPPPARPTSQIDSPCWDLLFETGLDLHRGCDCRLQFPLSWQRFHLFLSIFYLVTSRTTSILNSDTFLTHRPTFWDPPRRPSPQELSLETPSTLVALSSLSGQPTDFVNHHHHHTPRPPTCWTQLAIAPAVLPPPCCHHPPVVLSGPFTDVRIRPPTSCSPILHPWLLARVCVSPS